MKYRTLDLYRKFFNECLSKPGTGDMDWNEFRNVLISEALALCLDESGILTGSISGEITNEQSRLYLREMIRTFFYKNFPETPGLLRPSLLYEASLTIVQKSGPEPGNFCLEFNQDSRKNMGIFYTPSVTAARFVSETMKCYQENRTPRILDLASGCGIFSLELLALSGREDSQLFNPEEPPAEVINLLERIPGAASRSKLNFLFRNISGLEMDPVAVNISSFTITLASLSGETAIITHENFLKLINLSGYPEKGNVLGIFTNDEKIFRLEPEFDIVISNPPYISYYSRQSQSHGYDDNVFHEMKSRLESLKNPENQGRINAIMFFIEYAFRKTLPNGLVGILCDMNIHEAVFRPTRNWLLSEKTLVKAISSIRGFPEVNSGQTFLFLKNSKANDRHRSILCDNPEDNSRYVSQEILRKESSFQAGSNGSWTQKLHNSEKLGSYATVRTGVNIGGSSADFLCTQKIGAGHYPMASTDCLTRAYRFLRSENTLYIDYNPGKVSAINRRNSQMGSRNVVSLGNLKRFLNPKIFIRQSAPAIIAAAVEEEMVCPYSMFVVNPGSVFSLEGLLAILNSRLITNFARETGIIRSGPGKQPQIRKKGIENIPVPSPASYLKSSELLQTKVHKISDIESDEEYNILFEEIEIIVTRMFGLDPSEIPSRPINPAG